MNFTEIRLRIRHFVRKNKRLLFTIFVIWAIIFIIDKILGFIKPVPTPDTSYEPHVSVLDSSKATPKSLQKLIEEYVKDYVDACNDGNYQKAFDMLSDDCKKYSFGDNIQIFMVYVLNKMPMPRKYSLQEYSIAKLEKKNMYIYEVKYFEDFLATGLTNSTYTFTSEKIMFQEGDNGLEMNVGDYIYHEDLKSMTENEYLKIDLIERTVNYESEEYTVKFLNRSNNIIVISDGVEADEVSLVLSTGEQRNKLEQNKIVLYPFSDDELTISFPKFVDDGDDSNSINFGQIRVMEKYSGTDNVPDEVIQDEINNATKFAMEVKIDS